MRVVKRAKTSVFAYAVMYNMNLLMCVAKTFSYVVECITSSSAKSSVGKLHRVCVCVRSLQVVFEHEGVFIHPGSDEDGIEQDLLISGSLRIVDKVKFFHRL